MALEGCELWIQQFCQVLVILPDLEVVVALHHSVQRLQRACHQLQQGAFACTIGAH